MAEPVPDYETLLAAAAGHVGLSGAGLRMGWGDQPAGSALDLPPIRIPEVPEASLDVPPIGVPQMPEVSLDLPPIRTPEVPGDASDLPPGPPPDVAEGVPVFREPPGDSEAAQPLVYASQAQGIDLESAFSELFGETSQGPPDIGTISIGGVDVGKGSHVRIDPKRRADAHDIFLKGRHGKVAGVFEDVDGQIYVAVTLEDDPSGELNEWYGRYYYFDSTEVEPLEGRDAGPEMKAATDG